MRNIIWMLVIVAAIGAGVGAQIQSLNPSAGTQPATSEGRITFEDATAEMGIVNFVKTPEKEPGPADDEHHYFRWPFNLCVGDFDGDGWPDLFCGDHSSPDSGYSHLLLLDPKAAKFNVFRGDKVVRVAPEAGNGRALGRGAYVSGVVDSNDDGLLDLVFTDGDMAGTLLRNSSKPGLPALAKAEPFSSPSGLAFADLDHDGTLDTAVSAAPGSAFLYRGVGTQKKNLVVGASVVWEGFSHGNVIAADFNNDGYDDLLISEIAWSGRPGLKNRVRLLINQGGWKFEDVTEKAGLGSSCTGCMAVGDLTHSGNLDIVVLGSANTDHPDGNFKVYRNDGAAHFQDVTSQSHVTLPKGLGWEHDIRFNMILVDLDNDGFEDLVTTARYYVCRNKGDGTFADFTALPAGLAHPGSNGLIAAADFHGDGRMDLAGLSGPTSVAVLRNTTQTENKYLQVRLSQTGHNVLAVGARVYVYQAGMLGQPGGLIAERQIMANQLNAVVYCRLHLGVGQREIVDLSVVFPNGKVVEKKGLATNQTLAVTDAEATRTVEFKPRAFTDK